MGLDIRLPIGLMFAIIGAMLAAYGVAEGDASQRFGMNVNLVWGACIAGFGLLMLALWRFGSKPAGDPRAPGEPRGGDRPRGHEGPANG